MFNARLIRTCALTLSIILLLCAMPALALSTEPMELDAPENYPCASYILVEPDSGQVIVESNADERRTVASVTKVMTILLTIEAIEQGRISLEDEVVVSQNAAGMGGSQVLLDVGEAQPVDILLKSTIVGSANDAAVALAEHIYGSVALFVDKMNERARELGMDNTNFVNTTGLPTEGQYTTARDVARMARELSKHELFYDYSGIWLDEVDHKDGRVTMLTNTNRLIRLYDGCDGMKTGSTNEAGYCVAATAARGGMRLVAVVLGAPTSKERFDTAGALMDYGFANYKLYPVAEKGAKVRGELPVTGGEYGSVSLELDGDFTLLTKKGDEQEITMIPNLPESIAAPVDQGDIVGSVDVVMGGRTIAKIPVVAAEAVGRQGFVGGLLRIISEWRF